ncbi:phosphatase PAP2 family protein [Streptomyces sp. NPDC058200]|uniref:phosphatase PAP2 family protein n=1 Tax=Streptomyces sp. NPDC058200 TaxID=3346378 RepID=UPI0036E2CA6F
MIAGTGAAPLQDGSWFDDGLYTSVTDLAQRSPVWLDTVVSSWSTYGLALFGVLLLAAWWRARPDAPARSTLALAAPLVVVVSYLANDGLKSLLREQRPCQTLHTLTIEACPPLGDWSLPSNHAAIAAAAATALLFTDRVLAAVAVLAALLMAVSRVWVGAHYPHDVALGLVAGTALSWTLMVAARRTVPLVERLRDTRLRPPAAPR